MDLINILFAKALNKGDATKEYVNEAIAALKGEVNADLDTLEELSRALGNDPDFFLTVKNEIDSFKTELVTDKDTATENTRFAIGTAEQTLEVPNMEEFNQLKDEKLSEPAEGLAVGKYFRVAALDENGHAVLEAVDAKTVGVQDVQVAGASVVADGVANVPIATKTANGVMRPDFYGVGVSSAGILYVQNTSNINITNRVSSAPLTAYNLDYAVKAAMCDGKGAAWTADEQAKARGRIGIPGDYELISDVTLEEDINGITFSKEPDGTPLNLKKFIVMISEFPEGSWNSSYLRIDGWSKESSNLVLKYLRESTMQNKYVFLAYEAISPNLYRVDAGVQPIKSNIFLKGNSDISSRNYAGSMINDTNIVKINVYRSIDNDTLPAGINIKLYGVRV